MQIKAVAKMANVSPSTVSRVVNNSKAVSPELKKKVLESIEKLDYSASHMAKSLKVGQTHCIAIVTTSIERIFFTEIVKEISRVCHERRYMVQILETYDNPELEMQMIRNLHSQWVDGIILVSSIMNIDSTTQKYIKSLSNLRKKSTTIPVIMLEGVSLNPEVSSVSANHLEASRNATMHLFDTGRKRVVHIASPKKSPRALDRINGYLNACNEYGIESSARRVIHGDYTVMSGYTITNQMIRDQVPFDGIFASNDQMAIGALQACKEAGLVVPTDIAIIGYDDILLASLVEPALSTIRIPQKQIGILAVQKLFELLDKNGDRQAENIIVDTELVIRESTVLSAKKRFPLYEL